MDSRIDIVARSLDPVAFKHGHPQAILWQSRARIEACKLLKALDQHRARNRPTLRQRLQKARDLLLREGIERTGARYG
jgi:hypothetical protein